jgi:hypothetical protein
LLKKFHTWAEPILIACPFKKHVMIKHVRSANVSYFSEGVSQLGAANMPPRDISYLFEGVGA